MNMVTINGAQRPSFLERLSAFLGKSDGQKQPQSPQPFLDGALIERLKAISAERSRVRTLIDEEEARAEEHSARLQTIDADRVSALTAARLEGRPADQERAAALHSEGMSLRTSIEDSKAVRSRLQARLEELDAERNSLRFAYQQALTAFLDALYERAIARYNELAPEVAEAVLEVAAMRRVMMSYRLGNTNGWSGEVLLPGMRAKEGRLVPPILQGDSYGAAADQRTGAIYEVIKAAGFVYGLEQSR